MLRNRIVHHLLVGLLGAGVGIVASCQNEDTTSSCYPLSIWVDYGPSQASLRGFCRWGGDSGQDFPERDYGEGVYRRTVVRAVELDEGQLCDGCNAEQIDSLLRQEIENECDAPVLEFTRGCHEPHPRLAGWCFYTALLLGRVRAKPRWRRRVAGSARFDRSNGARSSAVLGSVVNVGANIAHEIGHTMGLAHDSVYVGGYAGFMRDTVNAAAPVLDWDAPSLVPTEPGESDCATGLPPGDLWTQGEVWADLLLDKRHPRPSGFKFRGCSQTGCSSAHPLQCNGGSIDMCIPGGS